MRMRPEMRPINSPSVTISASEAIATYKRPSLPFFFATFALDPKSPSAFASPLSAHHSYHHLHLSHRTNQPNVQWIPSHLSSSCRLRPTPYYPRPPCAHVRIQRTPASSQSTRSTPTPAVTCAHTASSHEHPSCHPLYPTAPIPSLVLPQRPFPTSIPPFRVALQADRRIYSLSAIRRLAPLPVIIRPTAVPRTPSLLYDSSICLTPCPLLISPTSHFPFPLLSMYLL
ncbi:hypothetical protein C8J57DRAFT_179997 [Mycena rebaudengoi]|nr:hypothetical protein C8J57DRAFT_179997 [Mycena rebaudengoi]